ncbi:MAG: DUF2911 domain-containing protein [Flavobacteriaceae bacterium]
MMKNVFFLSIALVLMSFQLEGQEFKGLDKSPLDMIEFPTANNQPNKMARVLYSRPQLRGRDVAVVVPEGKLWRMGANEATELTLYAAKKLNGKTIPAGSYTLYAIPSEGQMTVIVNSATHVWGAYGYKEADDVARITVPLEEVGESLEAFSMAFEAQDSGFDLHMGWGNFRARVPFRN